MSNDLFSRVSMDTTHPISPARGTDGQIKAVSQKDREVMADVSNDVSVSSNDVPAESRIVQEVSKSSLNAAVDDLSHYAQNISRDLQFSIDEELNKTIITVYDSATEEVIRQIPTEEVLQLARNIKNGEAALINVKA